jgi:hypothetical protein
LRYDTIGVFLVEGDINGDGIADFQINVDVPSNFSLTASDFIL